MSIFKGSSVKQLILSLIALLIIVLFSLILIVDEALAATGQDQTIRQVKTAASPAVYYLDYSHGLKKAYVSAAAFLSYGNKWPDIKMISQEELNKWPEMTLAKTKDSNQVYYISQSQKALIESEQQFVESGFKWSDIMTISQADLAEYKTIDFKVGGAIGDYSGNQLSITLDSFSRPADYLALNTQDNLVAIFSLKALGAPSEITRLVLDLKGMFSSDIIKEIYLTNESDIEYSSPAKPKNRQVGFNFNSHSIFISAGETKKIKVYVNLKDSSASVTNQTFSVAINQSENIVGVLANGTFPLNGETFKIVSGAGVLENVTANEQSLSIDNNQAIIGSTEKNVGKFILAETSGRADVFVKELKFTNQTKAGALSLNNFKLKNRAGQIISTVPEITSDREIVFKLKDYKIKKGSSETFTVVADIPGGSNGEDSLINLSLNQAKVLSSQGNFNLSVSITNLDENITVKRETLGVVARELKGNNKVFIKQSGVLIGNFEIRNNNQKINLDSINFTLEKSSGMPGLSGTVYLVDYNSGEVYGYIDGGEFNNSAADVDLGNLDLKTKQNLVLALVAKIPENAPNGGYYRIILNSLNYRVASGSYWRDTANSPGLKLTISKSSLYLYPNNELGDQTYIKGEKNIKIASFIIEGAAGGDTKITDLTFSRGSDSSGTISFDNGFSNLRFYIGSAKIKTIAAPYSGDIAVGGFIYVLKSGTRAEVKVYADTEKELGASTIQLAISNLAAVNSGSLIPAVVNNLNVNSFIVNLGQVSAELSKVTDGFVTKGENDNVIAGFKVKNSGNEDLKLGFITINAADQELTYSLGYSNLRVVNRDQQRTAGSTISRPVAGANKINLGGYIVKAGEEAIFDVHVKTSSLIADQNMVIYFSNFTAQGKTSKVNAAISGDPTDSFNFTVAVGSGGSSGNPAKTFIKPVSGSITYRWHDANYPFRAAVGEHTGIDIIAAQGTRVKAAAAGTVIAVISGSGDQASYITISHSNGLVTKYAHLSRLDVQEGDQVKQGDTIGLSGGTPGTIGAGAYTNGAHLHFEVLLNGANVNPENYL